MQRRSPYAKQWGARIQRTRSQLGYSQEWLAEQVGVKQAQVSRWESGDKVPTDINRIVIAHALGVDPNWLFRYDDDPPTNGDDEQAA